MANTDADKLSEAIKVKGKPPNSINLSAIIAALGGGDRKEGLVVALAAGIGILN
jgi:hypothetical protein